MYSIASPNQARSQQALERFLNVAAEQLANNTFEETGIAQLAQLAESSVGTFYRLLGDKDLLLYAVHTRLVERAQSSVEQLTEQLLQSDLPLQTQLERFIEGLQELFAGNEGLLRALVRRSSTDVQFRKRFHLLNDYISQMLSRLVLSHPTKLQHPRPEQAANLAAHMLLASMNYLTMVGTLGNTPANLLPSELARLVCSYLQTAPHA